jgi:hypothetical protein
MAAWTRQQIREAFPDQTGRAYLLQDRDSIHRAGLRSLLAEFGTAEVVMAHTRRSRIRSWSA